MRPDPEMIPVLIDTTKALKGSQRRLCMAKTADAMGRGGQIWAEAHLGWNRERIRKGMHEFRSGMTCVDAFRCRRRNSARTADDPDGQAAHRVTGPAPCLSPPLDCARGRIAAKTRLDEDHRA
jgi:hypothetical protein